MIRRLFLLFLSLYQVLHVYPEEDSTEQVDEWHMDYVPTGYFPDAVYRDLAWYGLHQSEPLYYSSKLKAAAKLIWQHTLGRPHVIMETPTQSSAPNAKISRQTIAEEGSKWSREQKSAQELSMENIKTGGNGITVRTVISAKNKTVYIIQNGVYYECPEGSEPDLDVYRQQTNVHDRYCSYGKKAVQIPFDPCIDGETSAIEYSYNEGWMFCFGNGERDSSYFINNTLDCGKKHKMSIDEFYDMCAIDSNIVITYDYFGDEPRKDLMKNSTICPSLDPCRVSYLYRLERPLPLNIVMPTTTPDPCDTTVCEDCIEGATEDEGVAINLEED